MRFAFIQDRQRRPVVKEEKVWRGGKLTLDRPNDEDRFGKILLFIPTPKGVDVKASANIPEFQHLLEAGLSAAEVIIPHTRPPDAVQLPLMED